MIVSVCTDKQKYQSLWSKHKLHLLQSWEWGQTREKLQIWDQVRLLVDDDLPVSISIRAFPLTGKLAYIPRLTIPEGFDPHRLLQELGSYLHHHLHVDLLLVDPNWQVDKYPKLQNAKSDYQIQPQYTNQVKLNGKTTEEIFNGFKPKVRRNINKAERQEVKIQTYTNSETRALDDFYFVMQEVATNTDLILSSKHYFKTIWETLSADKMAKIHVATLGTKVIGAYMVCMDEIGVYELYGGVTSAGREVEAGYALKRASIQDALSLGKQSYDHWGVASFQNIQTAEGTEVVYTKSHPLARISEFKAGFGGEDMEFEPQMIFVFSQGVYLYYRLLNLLKRIVINLKKIV